MCRQDTGHSFGIGAATTAEARGVEDALILTFGRWKSSAYLSYVRLSAHSLAAVSTHLLHRLDTRISMNRSLKHQVYQACLSHRHPSFMWFAESKITFTWLFQIILCTCILLLSRSHFQLSLGGMGLFGQMPKTLVALPPASYPQAYLDHMIIIAIYPTVSKP